MGTQYEDIWASVGPVHVKHTLARSSSFGGWTRIRTIDATMAVTQGPIKRVCGFGGVGAAKCRVVAIWGSSELCMLFRCDFFVLTPRLRRPDYRPFFMFFSIFLALNKILADFSWEFSKIDATLSITELVCFNFLHLYRSFPILLPLSTTAY